MSSSPEASCPQRQAVSSGPAPRHVPVRGSRGARGWRLLPSPVYTPPRRLCSRHGAVGAATQATAELRDLEAALQAGEGLEKEALALQLVEKLRGDGVLRGFGRGRQVPKRLYTLEELRLNGIEAERFLSPEDSTLNGVQTALQAALASLYAALFLGFHWEPQQLLALTVALLFAGAADQIGAGGQYSALLLDTAGRYISRTYASRVARHEAGHFMVAYLVGLLPRAYSLSSLQALQKGGLANTQGGTQFCDGAFQKEVSTGRLSSSSLDRYACVALAGVAAETLEFGQAEGGLNDVQQLDGLLKALQFSQKKADSEVRWAVLNVVSILRSNKAAHNALAAAMGEGKSMAECFQAIESHLSADNLVEQQA